MEKKLIPVIALAALAALAQAASVNASDFHLWLKCKAIELYVNVTGANFTLPQCDVLLSQLNKTFIITTPTARPLPMIGVGELKMLNVSDPKAVFQQIREIRLAAIKELGKHLNRTVDRVYAHINASADIDNATERGLRTLMRVRALLGLVNASRTAIGAIDRNIERLKLLREVYRWANVSDLVRNMNMSELDKAIDRLEKVMERLRELQSHLEKMKMAQLSQILALRARIINETISILQELKTLTPEERGKVVSKIASQRGAEIREIIKEIIKQRKAPIGGASGEAGGSGQSSGGGQGGAGGQASGGGSGGWSGGQGSGGGSGSGQGNWGGGGRGR
ncbi:hypothetical protein [Pyrobaculum islandicum]|nr:hypothetical protein [Pyrobaculum islandicum]